MTETAKNAIIFGVGVVVGAAAGAFTTYIYSKKVVDAAFAEVDDLIAENETLRRGEVETEETGPNLEEADTAEDPDDRREYANNDGVKKYHHKFDIPKEERKVTEGEKALKANPAFNPDGDPKIKELKEDTFNELVEAAGGDYELLTYLYPQDELYYGYGTDNEELAEDHYNMGREQIIGQTWRWVTDYTHGESGIGYIYIYNEYLDKYIDVEVMVDLTLEE